jgi:outer membrane lipoprotein SlyB
LKHKLQNLKVESNKMKNDMKLIMESWRRSSINEADNYSTDFLDQVLMRDFITTIDRARGMSKKYATLVIKTIESSEKAKSSKFYGKVIGFLKKATIGGIIGLLAGAAVGATAATGGLAAGFVAMIGAKAVEALLSQVMAEVEEKTGDFFVNSFLSIQKKGPPQTRSQHLVDMDDSTELLMKGGDRDYNKSPMFLEYIRELSTKWDEAIDKYTNDVEQDPSIANTAKVKDYLNFTADSFAKKKMAAKIGAPQGYTIPPLQSSP